MEISLEKYEEMQDRIAQLETAIEIKSKAYDYALDLVIERDDIIYALRAKQPHWISVKDRLPAHGIMVMVYSELCGFGFGYLDGEGKWHGGCDEDVECWMQFPEPPESEE